MVFIKPFEWIKRKTASVHKLRLRVRSGLQVPIPQKTILTPHFPNFGEGDFYMYYQKMLITTSLNFWDKKRNKDIIHQEPTEELISPFRYC